MENRNWRLPEGVEDLLPPDAWTLELLRRRALDVFRTWGFEYIDAPVVEYLDALLVGAGTDLDLQTLKTVDQKSGRQLGVRADMTAQAVRIDAHSRPVEGIHRLCYTGKVVFANPVSPLDDRVPLKAGAELFGLNTPQADAEVVALMLEVLTSVGIEDPILVLGHMGIYQSLVTPLNLPVTLETELFTAVQSKSEADIVRLLDGFEEQPLLVQLPRLMGERDVLKQARTTLGGAGTGVLESIDQLDELADLVLSQSPSVKLRFDLAELAGYGYHNGPVFSAYHAARGRALARGGRYDGIGAAFGRARAATGFDMNLNELVGLAEPEHAIWAPWADQLRDRSAIADRAAALSGLRAKGEVVVVALSADDQRPLRCDRILKQRDGDWVVDPVAD